MPTKTYYAKLDCLSTVATNENLSGEVYKSFCDFMSYLTASNVATLVSWNSGSGAISGSFDSRTYWNGSRPFGLGSHTLWRFNTSSTRNWEWYLYTQVVSASDSIRQSFNTPISGYGGQSDVYWSNSYRGILMQAAVCFSGSSSFNPWNGSLSDGSGNASQGAGNGLIRWVSGANDRTLYVLPRSNDLLGANSTRKDNGVGLDGAPTYYLATQTRYNFICDGDALLITNDTDNNSTYKINYIGPFELKNNLTASGICGSDYGLIMYTGEINNDTIGINTVFGDTAGTNVSQNGGIAVPIGNMINGSKTAIPQANQFLVSTYQPNTLTSTYDEFPVYVGGSEAGNYGYLGNMNSGLIRYVVNLQSHDMKNDFSRAIVGGTTTLTNKKISIPWTGSVAIGVSTSRTGSNFTWTTNYG